MQTDSRVKKIFSQPFLSIGKGLLSAAQQQRCAIIQLAYTRHTGINAWASMWQIRGLSAQSSDPRFAQANPRIVPIRTLRTTYIYTHIIVTF